MKLDVPPSLLPVFDALDTAPLPPPKSQAVLINSAMAQEAKYWVSLLTLEETLYSFVPRKLWKFGKILSLTEPMLSDSRLNNEWCLARTHSTKTGRRGKKATEK